MSFILKVDFANYGFFVYEFEILVIASELDLLKIESWSFSICLFCVIKGESLVAEELSLGFESYDSGFVSKF